MFPLVSGCLRPDSPSSAKSLSRRSSQNLSRRARINDDASEALMMALNWMHDGRFYLPSAPANTKQVQVAERTHMGWPNQQRRPGNLGPSPLRRQLSRRCSRGATTIPCHRPQ